MNVLHNSSPGFHSLGVAPRILDILTKVKYTVPTPIQMQAIPPAIEGKDIVGIAQTGTGKTLAFSVPMLQRMLLIRKIGLVLLPTRELAIQVNGKLRATDEFAKDASAEQIKKDVLEIEAVQKHIDGKQVKNIIVVPGKIVNIVVV